MGSVFVYAVSSAIILAILWGTWKFTMGKLPCRAFNRKLLVIIYVVSIVLWPVKIILDNFSFTNESHINVGRLKLIQIASEPSGENFITSITPVLITLYVIGLFLTMAYFLWGLLHIYIMRRQSKIVILPSGRKIRVLNGKDILSFSFLGEVFIEEKYLNTNEGELMIMHEQIHSDRLHWTDLLLANTVCLLQWFNPVAWLMLADLKAVHEFEVDSEIVVSGVPVYQYQLMLLNSTLLRNNFTITNYLNQNSLKTRIAMMCKKSIAPRTRFRALALVPAFLSAVAITSLPTFEAFAADIRSADFHMVEGMTAVEQTNEKEKVHLAPEVIAEFPGGQTAMMKFLMENMRYPKEAHDANEEGKVVVSFIVKADGQLTDIKVTRGVSKSLDEEAIRVVKSFPRWTPGKVKGKNVATQYSIPIHFKLK